jgi:hypothetical protein
MLLARIGGIAALSKADFQEGPQQIKFAIRD